jgi:aminoglycoside phosphotransferase family enzyme/predicted kinase
MALPEHLQSLLSPQAYPHPVEVVRLVETHISWLLLTGNIAYKIKRPVHFPFVDLRSPERRAFLCREEVRLNRRFAHELYLGVSHITADLQGARMDGVGADIEACVRMHQFDSQQALDHLLESGAIQPSELFEFGRELARIHAGLPAVDETHEWGRPAVVHAMLLRNFDECIGSLGVVAPIADAPVLRRGLDEAAKSAAQWMAARRSRGRVRECHGDLHCSNIVRLVGKLRAFDCLEFDPALRWIDVADEISFLLADLTAYDNPCLQQAFLGGYLLESGDYDACRYLYLYQAHRFLVRAKVLALSGEGQSVPRFVAAARRALSPKRAALILMSGLSGSGKSWFAQRLAPYLGAVHIRSDVERKRLSGIGIDARAAAGPGQGLYSAQTSERLHEHLLCAAESLLCGGYTALIDATFIRRQHRRAFLELASRLGVPVRIVRCDAAQSVLEARIEERAKRGRDPSDADLSVLQWQVEHEERFEPDESPFVLRVRSDDPRALEETRRQLQSLQQEPAALP